MRVLVTGATGYLGSRLVSRLVADGHEVVATSRDPRRLGPFSWADAVEHARLDAHDPVSVNTAVRGVEAVVFLVHGMESPDFARLDGYAARYLAGAAARHDVRRIVYVSGLSPAGPLSRHLASRREVEEVLAAGPVPSITLRASMVVGAGSLSFESLRASVRGVPGLPVQPPIQPVPRWLRARLQPVSVSDVLAAVRAALGSDVGHRGYDLGGEEVLRYPELLARYARVAGLTRVQVPVLLAPPALAGEGLALATGAPRPVMRALTASLRHDMVCDPASRAALRRDLLRGHDFVALDEAFRRSRVRGDDATRADVDPHLPAPTDAVGPGARRQVR